MRQCTSLNGEKDFNLANTVGANADGFVKEDFSHVPLLEIPKHGHKPPLSGWLEKAIEFVDEGKE
ncbi:MAG: hypothetical protein L7V87_01900 [Verrucomicrobiales bacterium]|nr:hypothetical protein [Verrucomicrobiales bacterium]